MHLDYVMVPLWVYVTHLLLPSACQTSISTKTLRNVVGVFIYYCNDVKKRPQRGCSIQLVATETADAIMAISVQGNYVIEITVKIKINE